MGTVEISRNELVICSHIVTYGNAADPSITEQIRDEIESMWNEPEVFLELDGASRRVKFRITAAYAPTIDPVEILGNTDPRNNYFRIENFARGNISFVDGVGCNTGYFKLENLYKGSTTAAHEYGHTIGLDHPEDMDLRTKGVPGIMYPRGTLVDSIYQYNPAGQPGDSSNGGTMHPKFRRVQAADILQLNLHRLELGVAPCIIGTFSSIWHPDHSNS